MATAYILYNAKAGTETDQDNIKLLEFVLDDPVKLIDIRKIKDYGKLLSGLEPGDYIVIAGGDGTLNHFVNDTQGLTYPCEILYYPCGTGNDFAKELGHKKGDNPFPITQYLKNLPTVEVKGKARRFINGVGFGIDGYCCEMGDELKKTTTKPINYTAIAIKGLLFYYKPTKATVTVDGVRHEYKKVWIAPTMVGKCYGGGMYPTPDQDRNSGELSVMLYHNAGKIKALTVFPSIFKGEHIKHTEMVEVLTGKEISVEFDEPRSLQIDGETVLSVKSFSAKAPAMVAEALC